MKPIVCLDFDGVIHSYTSGWKGAGVIPDPPVPGSLEFIIDALEYYQIAIFSSRSRNVRGRRAMKRWMRHHLTEWAWSDREDRWKDFLKVPADWTPFTHGDMNDVCQALASAVVKRVKWPWFKPPAMLTIDDRAICFTGTFPTFREIGQFQPWYKRPREVDIETKVGPPPFGYGL